MSEQENEADEYLDAFVALGGGMDKEGSVSRDTLVGIIKAEFELTIDMEVRTFNFDNEFWLIGLLTEDWR